MSPCLAHSAETKDNGKREESKSLGEKWSRQNVSKQNQNTTKNKKLTKKKKQSVSVNQKYVAGWFCVEGGYERLWNQSKTAIILPDLILSCTVKITAPNSSFLSLPTSCDTQRRLYFNRSFQNIIAFSLTFVFGIKTKFKISWNKLRESKPPQGMKNNPNKELQ